MTQRKIVHYLLKSKQRTRTACWKGPAPGRYGTGAPRDVTCQLCRFLMLFRK
jgi:hypothetical protein